ncbi:Protocatechuate 3,4-dioxygenase alpha chain [Agrobacterium tumefaciens]|nr:Protocatechuate 3,4-dioxygenase alpha chain [Agrobacterium tumefaciens]
MDTGEFVFETIKPGKVPFRDGRPMAPHITFWIVARGINIGLQTRMYFPEEQEAKHRRSGSCPCRAEEPHPPRLSPKRKKVTSIVSISAFRAKAKPCFSISE